LKKPNTKRAGGVAQGVGPKFKPRYHKKKEEEEKQKSESKVYRLQKWLLDSENGCGCF
jgi:hypothetical protein